MKTNDETNSKLNFIFMSIIILSVVFAVALQIEFNQLTAQNQEIINLIKAIQ